MSATRLAHCPGCGWTGDVLELDDSQGGPNCPTCGDQVRVR
ncbi:hypothetical protein [Salinigranum halophilum]|nr:hypothetical protein [Salinigranum halophilum]